MRAGSILYVTREASVQFIRPIRFRLIRIMDDRHPYDGWVWLDGYQLNAKGDAVSRRSIYVRREPLGIPDPRKRKSA
jgi:hypothetical protein